MKKLTGSSSCLAVGLLAAISLQGATIYYGADNGAGPGDARPLSDGARSAFVAATGATGPITFEGLAVGFNANFTAAPGVDVTMTNLLSSFCGGVCATDAHSPDPLGFNVTANGSQHLRVVPAFGSEGGAVTFTFAVPVYAFGFYLTDTDNSFPGPIHVTFYAGGSQSLSITKNNNLGGALFWGYSDPGVAITSFSLTTGATTSDKRDLWGIDDVYYAQVPEPRTMLLLGAGLAYLGWRRRRSKQCC